MTRLGTSPVYPKYINPDRWHDPAGVRPVGALDHKVVPGHGRQLHGLRGYPS